VLQVYIRHSLVLGMDYPPLLLLKYDDLCIGGCTGLLDNLHNNWTLPPGETWAGATIWLRLLYGPQSGVVWSARCHLKWPAWTRVRAGYSVCCCWSLCIMYK